MISEGLVAWPAVPYFVPEENGSPQIFSDLISEAVVAMSENELERGLVLLHTVSYYM